MNFIYMQKFKSPIWILIHDYRKTNCFVYLNFVSWSKLEIPCIIDIYKRKKWELN